MTCTFLFKLLYPLPRFQHIPTPLTGLDSEEASGLNDHLTNLRDASFMPFRSKSKEVRKKSEQMSRWTAGYISNLFNLHFKSFLPVAWVFGSPVPVAWASPQLRSRSETKRKQSPFRFFLHEKSSWIRLWSQSFLKWEEDNFFVQNTSVCWASWDERRWTDRKIFSLLPRNLLGLHLWCLRCRRRLWQWPSGLLDNKRPFRVVNDLLFSIWKNTFQDKRLKTHQK